MSSRDTGPLARLDQATQLLAKARTVDEVKLVRDQAEVARLYARERKLGLEAQNHAAEIKIRAERRLGELLEETPKQHGARDGTESSRSTPLPPSLKELGVSKDESSQCQQIAALPEPVFEKHLAETKADKQELTTASVVRLAKQQQQARDAETADRVLAAAFDVNPGGEQRIKDAQLRTAFAKALVKGWDLVQLQPAALARVLDADDAAAAGRLIDEFGRWAADLTAELNQPLRAVK